MRDEYEITDSIQILVDDDLPVYVSEVIRWDINLTSPTPSISNCVIFPRTDGALTTDIDRFVLTPEHQIDCRLFAAAEIG